MLATLSTVRSDCTSSTSQNGEICICFLNMAKQTKVPHLHNIKIFCSVPVCYVPDNFKV